MINRDLMEELAELDEAISGAQLGKIYDSAPGKETNGADFEKRMKTVFADVRSAMKNADKGHRAQNPAYLMSALERIIASAVSLRREAKGLKY